MEAMNLLVVERGADWSHWTAASQLLGQAAVILVQQADESGSAFRERIVARLQRIKTTAINAVVLLRGRRTRANRATTRFLRELMVGAKQGLRIFPSARRPRSRPQLVAAVRTVVPEILPIAVVPVVGPTPDASLA
jgi:hypothetical protein